MIINELIIKFIVNIRKYGR